MPNLFYKLALLTTCFIDYVPAYPLEQCNFTSNSYSGNFTNYGVSDISILNYNQLYNTTIKFFGIHILCNKEKILCNHNKVILPQNKSDCLIENLNKYNINPDIEYDRKQNLINIKVYGTDIILYHSS
jgi:hypothetical protein